MEARYSKRKRNRIDYKQLADSFKLPRAKKIPTSRDKLFPVKVLEPENDRVKVHYIGYGEEYDEWKDRNEIENAIGEDTDFSNGIIEADTLVGYQPFSLYNELRIKIKRSLTCSRTGSPLVKINIPFDILLFNQVVD